MQISYAEPFRSKVNRYPLRNHVRTKNSQNYAKFLYLKFYHCYELNKIKIQKLFAIRTVHHINHLTGCLTDIEKLASKKLCRLSYFNYLNYKF